MEQWHRCSVCQGDYDPCEDCARKDKEMEETRTYWCEQSIEHGNRTPSKQCKLKAAGVKEDRCDVCGYKFIYP